jgi:transcription antitermination factor NusG
MTPIVQRHGIEVGDHVRVVESGEFQGHTGMVHRISQHAAGSRVFFWIVFDNHPWQDLATEFAFTHQEIVKED